MIIFTGTVILEKCCLNDAINCISYSLSCKLLKCNSLKGNKNRTAKEPLERLYVKLILY